MPSEKNSNNRFRKKDYPGKCNQWNEYHPETEIAVAIKTTLSNQLNKVDAE